MSDRARTPIEQAQAVKEVEDALTASADMLANAANACMEALKDESVAEEDFFNSLLSQIHRTQDDLGDLAIECRGKIRNLLQAERLREKMEQTPPAPAPAEGEDRDESER